MKAEELINTALSEIRVKRLGYAISAEESQLALTKLNSLLAFWAGTEDLMIPSYTRELLALPLSVNQVTIGPTGDLVTARPESISVAKLLDGTTEYQLEIESLERFSREIDRTYGGRPDSIYYEPTYPNGTIYFDETTDRAYTLILNSLKAFTTFPDLVTEVVFPPEFERLITSNLAVEVAPDFAKEASQTTQRIASMTLKKFKNNNLATRVPTMVVDEALMNRFGRFDFDSGEFD